MCRFGGGGGSEGLLFVECSTEESRIVPAVADVAVVVVAPILVAFSDTKEGGRRSRGKESARTSR